MLDVHKLFLLVTARFIFFFFFFSFSVIVSFEMVFGWLFRASLIAVSNGIFHILFSLEVCLDEAFIFHFSEKCF